MARNDPSMFKPVWPPYGVRVDLGDKENKEVTICDFQG